jgi:hypothetical protein
MDVDKVERRLLALYKKMVVWRGEHVMEFDAFVRIINECVFEFWFKTVEGGWKKKTWVDDEHTGHYLRQMELKDEEALIRGKVRERLEKAAGMTALKAKYSEESQKDFDEILRYVNWWCATEQVEQEEKGETNGGNGDVTVQLAALREFIDQWECEQ